MTEQIKTLKPIKEILEAPSFMEYPLWLHDKESICYDLSPDPRTRLNHYINFFVVSNRDCQISLINDLNNSISSILKENSLDKVKPQASETINSWYNRMRAIIGASITSPKQLIEIVSTPEGDKLNLKEAYTKLSSGDFEADFIHKHPGCESNFKNYCLKMIVHENLGSPGTLLNEMHSHINKR